MFADRAAGECWDQAQTMPQAELSLAVGIPCWSQLISLAAVGLLLHKQKPNPGWLNSLTLLVSAHRHSWAGLLVLGMPSEKANVMSGQQRGAWGSEN